MTTPRAPQSISPQLALHRRDLRQAMESATGEPGAHLHGYLGAYCNNADCDIRQVLIRIKGHYGTVTDLRCPACRSLMLLGAEGYGATATTAANFATEEAARARANVAMQLRRLAGEWAHSGADFYASISIDDLGRMFFRLFEEGLAPKQTGGPK